MDPETTQQLKELRESELIDFHLADRLLDKGRSLKKTEPHDALAILRAVAMTLDRARLCSDKEKLPVFTECSDLGAKVQDPVFYFDLRAAQLFRADNNLGMAAACYQRAASSFITEAKKHGKSQPNDSQMQCAMLREARLCFELAGLPVGARFCHIKAKKIARDHAHGRLRKLKEWFSYIFWCWGESPLRVAVWGAVWIILFALVYCVQGVKSGEAYTTHSFLQSLYFSIVTFTTLGYGDMTPGSGLSRTCACVEAVSGTFFMGLFLVTFVRRFAR